ncbi:conserved oligomeric Golgi complex component [Haplosporangium sp. Z 27]|nr:conserved oligomeric Golgi complex component [Haplosporangium sp. Z 27]
MAAHDNGLDLQSNHAQSNNIGNTLNNSTDQDELFDLILRKVPPPKREMLSVSWSKDYLNRLTSLPARALHNEPEKLREEQLKVERDMSELAFRDYKTFILVKDCKHDVQSTFETLGQHLDHFQDTIPQFVDSLSNFSTKVSPILERQHVFSSILATHSQLLEVLEIPLLMETCVRNGYYNEALELATHVQRLVSRYPSIGLIQEIELKVAQGKEMMLVQLLAQLREPIKLLVAVRIIGFLRRIGSFSSQLEMVEEDEYHDVAASPKGKHASLFASSTSTSTSVGEDETPLKMLFLKSRSLYMNLQLAKVVHHSGDSLEYLKKYVEVTRDCLSDIMTQYKSIFGGVDHQSSFFSQSSSGLGSAATVGTESISHQQHCWTTENLLADFVTYRTQILLLVLKEHIPQLHDTSAISSILLQLMYFGTNMSKIGFDLRSLITSLIEEAVIRVVGGAFQRSADEFIDSLGGEGRNYPDWFLPSQWILSGTGRGPATSVSSLTLGRTPSMDIPRSSSSSMSPQSYLMDYPSLAYLTNSYLTALNSLRLLAPLSLAIPLREILVDSLIRVDLAIEDYDRFIFGERTSAFLSALLPPRSDRSPGLPSLAPASSTGTGGNGGFRMQGMEGSTVLNEQKIMDGFVVVYKRAVQDYILKCFDEGIYGGLVHVDVGQDDDVELDNQESVNEASSTEVMVEETKATEKEEVSTEVEATEVVEEGEANPTDLEVNQTPIDSSTGLVS